MKKIVQVSFPRSGTRILQFLLLSYFSKNPYFPTNTEEEKKEVMKKFDRSISFEMILNHYLKSHKIHCIGDIKFSHILEDLGNVDYIYCHDYPGDPVEILDNCEICIIQIRHPLLAGLSATYYNFKNLDFKIILEYFVDWKVFVNKWFKYVGENICFIKYHDFILDVEKYVRIILEKLRLDIDEDLLKKIIELHNIEFKNLEELKTLDKNLEYKKLFLYLENTVKDELKMLNIERIYNEDD